MEARVRALITRIGSPLAGALRTRSIWSIPGATTSLAVTAVLTFIEEVGQPASAWWIAAVALLNLLVVRLIVRLVMLAVLGCLLLFRAFRDRKIAGAGVVQGE